MGITNNELISLLGRKEKLEIALKEINSQLGLINQEIDMNSIECAECGCRYILNDWNVEDRVQPLIEEDVLLMLLERVFTCPEGHEHSHVEGTYDIEEYIREFDDDVDIWTEMGVI